MPSGRYGDHFWFIARCNSPLPSVYFCANSVMKCAHPIKKQKGPHMLYTIAVVLLILWLLGLITSNTMGGFIHILLVIAIVVVLLRLING
jgi:hypothetical protein